MCKFFHSGCPGFYVYTFQKMTRDNIMFKLLGKHLVIVYMYLNSDL